MRPVLICCLLCLPPLAVAEIYQWTDAQGRVHFSAQPGAATAERIEVRPQVVEHDPAARQRTQAYFEARRAERAAGQQRLAIEQARRAPECARMRSDLADLQRHGRHFQTLDSGERHYFSEQELALARERLQGLIAARCG